MRSLTTRAFGVSAALAALQTLFDAAAREQITVEPDGIVTLLRLLADEANVVAGALLDGDIAERASIPR